MDDSFYHHMYGGQKPVSEKKPAASPEKLATRVLGGMKAQNSHTKTVEVDGQLVNFPRAEYVKVLEDQIKQLRSLVREMETKQHRMLRNISKLTDEIRRLGAELQNKVDLR